MSEARNRSHKELLMQLVGQQKRTNDISTELLAEVKAIRKQLADEAWSRLMSERLSTDFGNRPLGKDVDWLTQDVVGSNARVSADIPQSSRTLEPEAPKQSSSDSE